MPGADWKGNKAHLPQKPCVHCGRAMTWRKRWARTWDEVRYCSDACRHAARVQRRPDAGNESTYP